MIASEVAKVSANGESWKLYKNNIIDSSYDNINYGRLCDASNKQVTFEQIDFQPNTSCSEQITIGLKIE